jgi:hypothetical protein
MLGIRIMLVMRILVVAAVVVARIMTRITNPDLQGPQRAVLENSKTRIYTR